MTGYEAPERIYRLSFEAHPGLEAEVREVPIGMLTGLLTAADGIDPGNIAPADVARVDELMAVFARMLVSWNVTRNGDPVPATAEGLASLSPSFAMEILTSGLSAITQAPPPLPAQPGSGATSPEAQLAQASQSLSRQTSPRPSS